MWWKWHCRQKRPLIKCVYTVGNCQQTNYMRVLEVCFKRVYFLKAHRDNTWTHTHRYCSTCTHTHSFGTILGPHCVCKQPSCLEGIIHLMFTSSAIVADGVKCPSGVFILSWESRLLTDWGRRGLTPELHGCHSLQQICLWAIEIHQILNGHSFHAMRRRG